jgi:hypothetical protein
VTAPAVSGLAPARLLVLGMHRSGTSAVTGLLHLMGCYVGAEEELMPAQVDNPRGYWERMDVYALGEEVLAALGARWDTVGDLDLEALPAAGRAGFAERMAAVVAELERRPPWVLKDPRLCLLLPLWRPLLPAPAIALLVHRRPLQVARSLQRRHGLPLPLGIALWERYQLAALEVSRGLPRLLVSYEELLREPGETCRGLRDEIRARGGGGLEVPSPEAVAGFIDPALRQSPAPPGAEDAYLNPARRHLLGSLADGTALDGPPPALSPDSAAILAAHAAAEGSGAAAGSSAGPPEQPEDGAGLLTRAAEGLAADAAGLAREVRRLREETTRLAAERDRLLVDFHALRADGGRALEKITELADAIAWLEEQRRAETAARRRLEAELAAARQGWADTWGTLRRVEASRSYRLGRALARPLAALRRLWPRSGKGG